MGVGVLLQTITQCFDTANPAIKQKAHPKVGFREGRIVSGPCAEGPETLVLKPKSRRETSEKSSEEMLAILQESHFQ